MFSGGINSYNRLDVLGFTVSMSMYSFTSNWNFWYCDLGDPEIVVKIVVKWFPWYFDHKISFKFRIK